MRGYRLLGIYLLVVLAIILWLCSCSPRVITVPEVHTEYINRTDTFTRTDTVKSEKETIIRELTKEDSLMLAQYGIRLKDNERMLLMLQRELEREKSLEKEAVHDTVIQRDSIPYPVYIEKSQTWWQKVKQDIGDWVVGIVLLVIVLFILYLIFSKKRK